ncbi:MAG: metallophosphoesterase [Bacteroidetes bacterium]|nr:metallophosphoesterase [Bacteroidota bacterium]
MRYIKVYFLILILSIWQLSCQHSAQETHLENDTDFSFAFMTDIHLQPEAKAVEGFLKAIDTVNKLNPDFVITGGDLIMDALGQNWDRANLLYGIYNKASAEFHMPVYNTMGNHEIFGIYEKSGVEKDNPEYGEQMFENRIGKRYYSFDHKGWHFMILDGIEDTGENSYIGYIDQLQMNWIQNDLKAVPDSIPIAISTHIPLITSATQLEYGSLEPNGKATVVNNTTEVLELFENHNLKLVLQGHLHLIEDIYAQGIHFITGGAVCARWWSGPYNGMEEGFMLFHVKGDNFSWEYIDFGWDAVKPE